MPDLSQGSSADVVLDASQSVRVSTTGQATVTSAYGAPNGTTTLNANTQLFGPYGVPAKLRITAVTGGASYFQPVATPVALDPATGGFVGADGEPVGPEVFVAAAAGIPASASGRAVSSVGVKCIYGYMDSGSHGVPRNTHIQTVLETDADWVQIGLLNGLAVPITGVRVAVGVAAALGADGSATSYTPDAWADALFGGAGTVNKPAGATARPSIVLSDRINLPTVARSDGGRFPVVHVRIHEPAANANVSKWSPGGVMAWMRSESATAGRVCRVMQQDGGDFVAAGGRASFNSTADASRWTPFFIVYGARSGKVTTVAVFGDSIRSGIGATNYLQGHHWLARERMSSSSQPVELAMFGWSGQTMPAYCNRLLDLAEAGVVQSGHIVAVGSYSPNDFTTAVTSAGVAAMRTSLAAVVAAASGVGAKLLIENGAPANPAQKDWNASDSLRVAWNAEVKATYAAIPQVDFAARLSAATPDGDGQLGFAVGLTTDNLHPNDAGYAAVLDDTISAINQHARWRFAQTAVAEVVAGQVVGLFGLDGSSMRFQMQTIRFGGSANSQYFTVPDGCTVIEADAAGGGGGGGGGFGALPGGGGGGGGSGQQAYRRRLAVIPGETLTINVPLGGPGGAVGADGGNPTGVSGSVLTVTGSRSGLLLNLTGGGRGRAGTAALGGNGGDTSGPLFAAGAVAPAAGTAGVAGTDNGTQATMTQNSLGVVGAGGGTGVMSTGAGINAGRGGRSTPGVQSGAGGATGAVNGNGAGGGGASGYPELSQANAASGGPGGNDSIAGTDGLTPGAGGGGGGRNAAGGKGADGFVRLYY